MAADSLAKASTPDPLGPGDLWHTPGLTLPPYIQHVAHALVQAGHAKSQAIQIAIGVVRRWAAGGGKVDAGTRAAAVKAVAEFEAARARAKATKTAHETGLILAWDTRDDVLELARYVRTEAGMRRFHKPIGALISGQSGDAHTNLILKHEGRSAMLRRNADGVTERRNSDRKTWRPASATEAKLFDHAVKQNAAQHKAIAGPAPKKGSDYVKAEMKARDTRAKNAAVKAEKQKADDAAKAAESAKKADAAKAAEAKTAADQLQTKPVIRNTGELIGLGPTHAYTVSHGVDARGTDRSENFTRSVEGWQRTVERNGPATNYLNQESNPGRASVAKVIDAVAHDPKALQQVVASELAFIKGQANESRARKALDTALRKHGLSIAPTPRAKTTTSHEGDTVLALAGFNPAAHPQAPAGSPAGGQFVVVGQARDQQAATAQTNKQAQSDYKALLGASRADRLKMLKGMNTARLEALSRYLYSFKSSAPSLVSARIAMAGELARRGLKVTNFGALGGGKPGRKASRKPGKARSRKAPAKPKKPHVNNPNGKIGGATLTPSDVAMLKKAGYTTRPGGGNTYYAPSYVGLTQDGSTPTVTGPAAVKLRALMADHAAATDPAVKKLIRQKMRRVAARHIQSENIGMSQSTPPWSAKAAPSGATQADIEAKVNAYGKVPAGLRDQYRRQTIAAARNAGLVKFIPKAWLSGMGGSPAGIGTGHVGLASPSVSSGDGPAITVNGALSGPSAMRKRKLPTDVPDVAVGQLTKPAHITMAVNAHDRVPAPLRPAYRQKVIAAAHSMGEMDRIPASWMQKGTPPSAKAGKGV